MYRSFLYLSVVFLLAACSGKGAVKDATQWKRIDGCSFSMRIPISFKTKRSKPARTQNPSDCNYYGLVNGDKVFDIYSSSASLFDSQDIDTLYKMAVDYSKFTIRHNEQKGNWFVVSGVNPETGNNIYWKRTIGREYITDLYFDYPKEKAAEVEPFIEGIAVSVVSD
jgi:hypothetical protein